MLVLERTDFIAKVYLVDPKDATNILRTKCNSVATSRSLEQLITDGVLESHGIVALPKQPVATFDSTEGYPQKREDLAVVNGDTLAIADDNDFGVGSFSGVG